MVSTAAVKATSGGSRGRVLLSVFGALLLGVAVVGTPAAGHAQDSHNADTVNRITRYREIGTANKNIVDQLASDHPDLSQIRMAAAELVSVGKGMPDWFPPGTGRPEDTRGWFEKLKSMFSAEAAVNVDLFRTRATPAVWEKPDEFRRLYAAYVPAAEKVAASAAAGDLGALKTDIEALGKVCQSCHEAFRHAER